MRLKIARDRLARLDDEINKEQASQDAAVREAVRTKMPFGDNTWQHLRTLRSKKTRMLQAIEIVEEVLTEEEEKTNG